MGSVPERLYRYRPLDECTKNNIRKRQVYFSKPRGFNDPFDCAIRVDQEDISDDEYWALLRHLQETKQNADQISDQYLQDEKLTEEFKRKARKGAARAIEDQIETMLHHRGAVCFSAVPPDAKDSILQWSHYAEGHTGLCLEFRTDFPLFSEGEVFEVTYSNTVPSLNPFEMIVSDKDFLEPMISTKADCWDYEKEWRLFHMEGGTAYSYSPQCLTAVYLACDAEQSDRNEVKSILSGSSTDVYQVHRAKRRFKLQAEPLEKG